MFKNLRSLVFVTMSLFILTANYAPVHAEERNLAKVER